MTKTAIKKLRTFMREENAKWPEELTLIARSAWPSDKDERRFAVWRSRHFLVQGFQESGGIIRLSVIRSIIGVDGDWEENITWDELQSVKEQCGFGDCDAVEIYPAEDDIVNVANMRHLWVLPKRIEFAWRQTK